MVAGRSIGPDHAEAARLALIWFIEVDPINGMSLLELLEDGDGRFVAVHHLAAAVRDFLEPLLPQHGVAGLRPAAVLMALASEFDAEGGDGDDYETSLPALASATGLPVWRVRALVNRLIHLEVIRVEPGGEAWNEGQCDPIRRLTEQSEDSGPLVVTCGRSKLYQARFGFGGGFDLT